MDETEKEDGFCGGNTYQIVQTQMRDLVMLQQATCDRLIENSIVQNSTIKENTISREEFQKLLKELEDERLQHAKTKTKLLEVEDKLEFAYGEVDVLQRQLEREKAQFEKAFEILQEKAVKESQQKTHLVDQCSALTRTAQKQQSTLSSKEAELVQVNKKLKQQKELYEKRVIELNLEKEQENYVNKVIEESIDKRTKRDNSRSILKPRN